MTTQAMLAGALQARDSWFEEACVAQSQIEKIRGELNVLRDRHVKLRHEIEALIETMEPGNVITYKLIKQFIDVIHAD